MDGTGAIVAYDETKFPVIKFSLAELIFKAPTATFSKGQGFQADLILPSEIHEHVTPIDLVPYDVDDKVFSCELVNPTYTALMSIRQFLLRQQNAVSKTSSAS